MCIAAANAGATSQDLKTGFLVGATPRRQQVGFIIGVLVSTLVIGGTLFLLDQTYRAGELHGIGGPKLAAPQATLMATIIKGLLAKNLPWAPVLVGAAMAFMAQMAGAHALSWAVGAYLPLSTTFRPSAPYFVSREDLAAHYQDYADRFALNIWLRTTVLSATWDASARQWTATVRRDGETLAVKATHMVLATGRSMMQATPAYANDLRKYIGKRTITAIDSATVVAENNTVRPADSIV